MLPSLGVPSPAVIGVTGEPARPRRALPQAGARPTRDVSSRRLGTSRPSSAICLVNAQSLNMSSDGNSR
ncbi:hypothetical protein BIWAKO_06599 [Bosea sp. BIWAKO-01]|nr:hypothetical protein BIWAKO_06599 [Bosea sp. BIWAKO-01]